MTKNRFRHCSKKCNRLRVTSRRNRTTCFFSNPAKIGALKLDSVLIEGGASIHASALKTGLVQQVQIYLAPKCFGGDGLSPIAPLGVTDPMQAISFSAPTVTPLGQDIRLDYFAK